MTPKHTFEGVLDIMSSWKNAGSMPTEAYWFNDRDESHPENQEQRPRPARPHSDPNTPPRASPHVILVVDDDRKFAPVAALLQKFDFACDASDGASMFAPWTSTRSS